MYVPTYVIYSKLASQAPRGTCIPLAAFGWTYVDTSAVLLSYGFTAESNLLKTAGQWRSGVDACQ